MSLTRSEPASSTAPQELERRRTPIDLDPDAFAAAGHRLVDDLAALLGSMRTRRVGPPGGPREARAVLGADRPLPEQGAEAGALLREATELLLPHSLYNGHPRFFGYITGAPAPIGILADLLASAVNPNLGAWALSPMASEIEAQTVRWLAELVGYPAGDGILTSGGNVANMLGFWAARAALDDGALRRAGTAGPDARRLRVYAGEGTHTWIEKAADLSGLGTDTLRWIAAGPDGRVDLEALERRVRADQRVGDRPFLVVGTAGSVATGAVDPLPELRALADRHGLWLHVDGAYGAFAAAVPDAPAELRGLALADSVALDPHKWLYAPLEAGCTLVRDPKALERAFAYHPTYYRFDGEAVRNSFDRGIQNSRGFRALKVWLQLRHAGAAAYRRMIAEDMALARAFHDLADGHPELEAMSHGLSITTYRYVPADLAPRRREPEVAAYLDRLNRVVQDRMERDGRAFVSHASVGGAHALRMCIVNFRTTLEDVRALADVTVELGREADAELREAALAHEGAVNHGVGAGPGPSPRG